MSLLEMRNVEVVYHRAATAVQGITLDVPEGRIVTLLGPNGAGKTTTLRAVSGFLDADDARVTDGEVVFDGARVTGWPPHRLARRGLVLVPEREKVFETLTVVENLEACRRGGDLDGVFTYFPQLAGRRRQLAGLLSGGERQMLAIGGALLCQPRVLLVDELSLGLAPIVVRALMETVRRLRDELALTIMLVEQNAAAALEIADHGYVIENGRIVHQGAAADLLVHEDVRDFYLGGSRSREGRTYRDVKQYRRRRRWFV